MRKQNMMVILLILFAACVTAKTFYIDNFKDQPDQFNVTFSASGNKTYWLPGKFFASVNNVNLSFSYQNNLGQDFYYPVENFTCNVSSSSNAFDNDFSTFDDYSSHSLMHINSSFRTLPNVSNYTLRIDECFTCNAVSQHKLYCYNTSTDLIFLGDIGAHGVANCPASHYITNFSIPKSCEDNGKVQILLDMQSCLSNTDRIYEMGVFARQSYPSNITVYVAQQANARTSIRQNTTINSSMNISMINNILMSGCTCENCSIHEDECYIPVAFRSETAGKLIVDIVNATSQYQIDNCRNNTGIETNATSINFTIYDETNLTKLISDTNAVLIMDMENVSFTANSTDNFQICIYPSWTRFYIDAYLKFKPINNLGYEERYYLINYSIDNVTDQISLFNFADTTGVSRLSATIYTYYYAYYPNLIMKMQRYYPAENLWRTVQVDKTDEFGKALFYVIQNSKDYRFFFDEYGKQITSTVQMKFICDSATECSQSFIVKPDDTSDILSGMTQGVSFNNVTNIITFRWDDATNTVDNVEFIVTKQAMDKIVVICDETIYSATGTATCNVSGYDGLINVRAYRVASPAEPFISANIEIADEGTLFRVIDQDDGVVMTFLVGLVCAMLGVATGPAGAIIGLILGFISMSMMGTLNILNTTYLVTLTLLGLIIGFIIKR